MAWPWWWCAEVWSAITVSSLLITNEEAKAWASLRKSCSYLSVMFSRVCSLIDWESEQMREDMSVTLLHSLMVSLKRSLSLGKFDQRFFWRGFFPQFTLKQRSFLHPTFVYMNNFFTFSWNLLFLLTSSSSFCFLSAASVCSSSFLVMGTPLNSGSPPAASLTNNYQW